MSISSAARCVARLLQQTNRKVVFAESCTGGLVSGSLTKISGISKWHCGGMVVYRGETKMAYLGIPAKTLKSPGPVSAEVASQMARRVLARTPEADIAASVTGHLGPDAPEGLDGVVYVGVAHRARGKGPPLIRKLQCGRGDSRVARQRWVIVQVLQTLAGALEATTSHA